MDMRTCTCILIKPRLLCAPALRRYILQYTATDIWPVVPLDGGMVVAMFVYLLSVAYLSAELVTNPARSWWLQQKPSAGSKGCTRADAKLWAWPASVAFLLVVIGVPYRDDRSRRLARREVTAPVVYIAPDAAVDARLNWTVSQEHPFFSVWGDGPPIINPSLLIVPQDGNAPPLMVRAARAHSVVSVTVPDQVWEGSLTTEVQQIWNSAILTATSTFDDAARAALGRWDVSAWGAALGGSAPMELVSTSARNVCNQSAGRCLISSLWPRREWAPLCEAAPTYIVENRTLFRHIVTGPEDPKLFLLPPRSSASRFALTFSSLPPTNTRVGCRWQPSAAVQMYLAERGDILAGMRGGAAVGQRVQCGSTMGTEKNWIAFVHRAQLYYVYEIFPHRIVQVRAADGACVQRYTSSSYAPLADLAAVGSVQLHGSATAVPFRGEYLALMHAKHSNGTYTTMAYRFAAAPPFEVTAVSRPLPLQGVDQLNFASGLLVPPGTGKVIVSYGAQDAEPRILAMSLAYFEGLFGA